MELDHTPEVAVDGRRARRMRGRLAVINAMIDLVLEGRVPPTTEEVAARAGVSAATLFRYFENLDELREQATAHYFERFSDAFEVPNIGEGPLEDLISTFVRCRVRQHEITEHMARLTRSRALVTPDMDATVHRLRATQSDQIRLHFAEQLAELPPAKREDAVAIVAALTSFESWDQFTGDHERSSTQIRRAWTSTIEQALGTR